MKEEDKCRNKTGNLSEFLSLMQKSTKWVLCNFMLSLASGKKSEEELVYLFKKIGHKN